MKQRNFFSGPGTKGIFFACLLSLLLFASNASAYLSSYSFNLIYANKELNSGAMDNYATVTVELMAQDLAKITFVSLDNYRLQNRLGVQANAYLFAASNLSSDGDFEYAENFSEFGDFNASFKGLGKLTSFSFDLTRKQYDKTDTAHWDSADQVLIINDQGYKAVAHIVPEKGESGYAAGNGDAVPIPGAVWLLGSGLIGLLAFRRRTA